jgi:hypothetical protein
MKTQDFAPIKSSDKLAENLVKQFNTKVNLNSYGREQLEDIRNKLRTKIFQQEGSSKFNDLLTNETYQKDKAMLELLNTRIKEMLGEQMKQLRDKMDQLTEAKKGDGNLANNAKPYDKVTRGDVIAGRLGKDEMGGKKSTKDAKVKEGFPTVDSARAEHEKSKTTGKFDKKEIKPGVTQYTRKSNTFTDGGDDSDVKAAKKKSKDVKEETGKFDKKDTTWTDKNGKKHPAQKVTRKTDQLAQGEEDKTTKEKKVKEGMKHPKDCDCKECMSVMERDEGKHNNKTTGFKALAKKTGGGEKGAKIAGAQHQKMKKAGQLEETQFKHNVRFVNESIGFLLQEDEEAKAKTITAAGDIVNDFTGWMQRIGQYQTKAIIELADSIRAEFGAAESEAFKQKVGPALTSALETLTQQREALSNAVAELAGEAIPETPMGMEPDAGMDADMDADIGLDIAEPDSMNPEDEFAASDAAAGGDETAGREMRESSSARRARKLAESHSILTKLAR